MSYIINAPEWLGFDKENVHLMNFAAEMSRNVTSPLRIRPISREFKELSGSMRSEDCLKMRIERYRMKIHLLDDLNIDTKVKMIFALSARVDPDFLNELKEHAYVELDNRHRIIKYKKNGGGLQLCGKHHYHSKQNHLNRDQKMLEFLAKISEKRTKPIGISLFGRLFKIMTKTTGHPKYLSERYELIRNDIYTATKFDKKTRIKMLFVSKARIHDYVLKELRVDATVEIDERRRITMYSANDGSLNLERQPCKYAKMKAEDTEDEDEDVEVKDVKIEDVKEEEEENSEEQDEEDTEMKMNISMPRSRRVFKRTRSSEIFLCASNDDVANCGSAAKIEKIARSSENDVDEYEELPTENVEFDAPNDESMLPIPSQMTSEFIDKKPTPSELNQLIPSQHVFEFGGNLQQQQNHRNEIDDVDFGDPEEPIENCHNVKVKNEILEKETGDMTCTGRFSRFSSSKSLPDVSVEDSGRNDITLQSSDNTAQFINYRKFMKLIRALVITLESPMLAELQEDIEKEIEAFGNKVKKTPIQKILMSLQLLCVVGAAKPCVKGEHETSLKEFLAVIKNIVIILNNSSLNSIQQEIKKQIGELGDENKTIPIKSILSVLETVLLVVNS